VASRASSADDEVVIVRPTVSAFRHHLRRLRREERGYTLTELLAAMSILLIVVSTLATVFVSGSNAEIDLSNRFEAQSNARLALDRFRREVHSACQATVSGASGPGYTTVTLSQESTTAPYPCSPATTWCAVGSSAPYKLYRKVGATCDATGARWADYLVTNALFTIEAPFDGRLPKVGVDLTVDLKPADASQRYRLVDSIAVRNYLRA
jgi:prepilin-type N-terminal cleavage/methylation domain-containing protein